MQPQLITLGELRAMLSAYPDDIPLYFGHGDLSLSRVRHHAADRGGQLQLEFNESYDTQRAPDLLD